MLERFIGHHRTEIRAPYADIDHFANAFAGMTGPSTTTHPVAEVRHLVEHGVNGWDYILTINQDRFFPGSTQRNMQNRTFLRDVDLVTAEHGINVLAQTGFLGELQQELQGLIGDPVFRIIKEESGCPQREPFATLRIVREQLTEVKVAKLLV